MRISLSCPRLIGLVSVLLHVLMQDPHSSTMAGVASRYARRRSPLRVRMRQVRAPVSTSPSLVFPSGPSAFARAMIEW